MKKAAADTLSVNGIQIGIYTTDFENEFISLTDIAKYRNDDDPRFVIQNWMRNRNTIEVLALWEELHNPDFNRVQFEAVKKEAGLNRFIMTPTKWIQQMNSVGIVVKAGRYGGGTYAHIDIAMDFATWVSPELHLYIMKDYRRIKANENGPLSLSWNLNREVAKLNYRIHTDAIKENLIPPQLTQRQIYQTYASEADLLNVALFGQTAGQWSSIHPEQKGNMRDQATIRQLLVLANMESYNAILIGENKSQAERLVALREMAIRQMQALENISVSNLPKMNDKQPKGIEPPIQPIEQKDESKANAIGNGLKSIKGKFLIEGIQHCIKNIEQTIVRESSKEPSPDMETRLQDLRALSMDLKKIGRKVEVRGTYKLRQDICNMLLSKETASIRKASHAIYSAIKKQAEIER